MKQFLITTIVALLLVGYAIAEEKQSASLKKTKTVAESNEGTKPEDKKTNSVKAKPAQNVGKQKLVTRGADAKGDAERFRLWKTLTENEPHRGVKLLVEADIKFFGRNEKRYLVCTRLGKNFVVNVLDEAPRERNGEYQYEFNFRTEHFGFSSEEGYWRLENGTAYILGDGVYPEGTKAWEEVDFLLGIKLLRGRDVMNMGFFNVPMGEIRWDGGKFAATNIYDEPVFGEIMETERGLPTKAKFTASTKKAGRVTKYLEYAYPTKMGGQAVVPRLISIAGDDANTGITYRILNAQFVNDPSKLFSVNHYLNPGVREMVDYTKKGDMKSRKFNPSNKAGRKHLWAKSYLNKKAPELVIEKWLSKKPDFKSKFLLVDFWATWCGGCIREIPKLNQYHQKFGDRMVIVGLSDETENKIRSMKKPNIEYFSAIDTKKRMKNEVKVMGIPHVMIIDPKGIVRWEGTPSQTGHELSEYVIQDILNGNGSKTAGKQENIKAKKHKETP